MCVSFDCKFWWVELYAIVTRLFVYTVFFTRTWSERNITHDFLQTFHIFCQHFIASWMRENCYPRTFVKVRNCLTDTCQIWSFFCKTYWVMLFAPENKQIAVPRNYQKKNFPLKKLGSLHHQGNIGIGICNSNQ